MQHPYASFVDRVQKPARYLGGEFGQVCKDWSDASIRARVCLAFPDVYDIGMSHLGMKILYGVLNDRPDLLVERAFSPWIDMEAELRARGLPLVSLESARPLRDFDVVGISLQFELTYSNCLQLLDLGGIALRSAARGDEDPLVVGGGPTATHPEPLAPFFDVFVIGDGEEAFPALVLVWAQAKAEGLPRIERLRRLAKIPGVYVPSLYSTELDPDSALMCVVPDQQGDASWPIRRALLDDINRYPFPADGPVPAAEAVFDRLSVEIARGCTEGCRFCQAGMIYRPVRERDPQSIIDTVVRSLEHTGFDEVALTSLSTADYSCVSPLVREVMRRLLAEKVSLSVSSLRAYGLDEELLDEIQKVRATGLTFAPEAGTQRMRDVINKNITEEQLLTTAERVFSRGWSKMKLYFMIGLPTERDEDVLGIVQTGRKAQDVGRRAQRGKPTVTVSVSTHVPKPHTPFQWAAFESLSEIERKQAVLRTESKRLGVDLKLHDPHGSVLEAVLARGDRRLADVIELAFQRGARFDSWDDQLDLSRWWKAFRDVGVVPSTYFGPFPLSAKLPWSHIDVGLEDGFLAREYRKALRDRLSPPCGKVVGAFVHATNIKDAEAERRRLVCYDCGIACDLSAMREQRLGFLRTLGAVEPPQRAPATTNARHADRGPQRPRPAFGQESAFRVRVHFEKTGPSAFLSHLDLLRALGRMVRRAGLRPWYSRGFHPKPSMVFGPALSLGVSSLAEFVDFELEGDVVEAHELVARLHAHAPDGLIPRAARLLGASSPSIAKLLGRDAIARYAVGVPRSVLPDLGLIASRRSDGGPIDWTAAVASEVEGAFEGGQLSVMRRIDGVGRRIDVRKYLIHAAVSERQAAHDLERAGLIGDAVPIQIEVRLSQEGGVKVSEVVEALLGKEVPFRAVRSAMWISVDGRRLDPLDASHGGRAESKAQLPIVLGA